jgi:hypothetical protein
VVLVFCMGLHLALLQTVAWTGMLISYSRDGSFAEAVVKTFDGEHPCPLCKVIREGRAEGEEQAGKPQLKPDSKLDPGLVWDGWTVLFGVRAERSDFPRLEPNSFREGPPKPRPRHSAACAITV